jgi:hypothetical protein
MREAPNFDAINQAALAAFPAVLRRLLPGRKTIGREIVVLNPRRAVAISARSRSTDTPADEVTSPLATRAAKGSCRDS